MKASVIVFPGSNCDRDLAVALQAGGADVTMVWHKDNGLPEGTDLVAVPGGFSFGDYLRCGAIAAQSPIASAVKAHVERGGYAFGICNGFQVLCETGCLPGVLIRNATLNFICRSVPLTVEATDSGFTQFYQSGEEIALPVAHHDGNYRAGDALDRIEGEGRVAFRYGAAVNGSENDIAGVLSENRRVLGMMPHPERAAEPAHGSTDGARMFRSLVEAVVAA